MAKRPFTPTEKLVGRPLPKDASYRDQLLAGYLKKDGTPCGRMTPGDRWLMAAHRDLRKSGLIRSGIQVSLMGGRPTSIWYLTEKGIEAAREAASRVISAREDRRAWSRDFLDARRAAMKSERDGSQEAPSDVERDPDPC
jgi:hypothetical protein